MTTVYLDTAASGWYGPKIVEIVIVGDDDGILLKSLVNPGKPIEFDATWIHDIDDEKVADAPTIEDLTDRIDAVLSSADEIVIFDMHEDWWLMPEMIRAKHGHKVWCCMLAYSEWYNDWIPRYEDYRIVGLREASCVTDFDPSGLKKHKTLRDALACGHIWRHIHSHPKRDHSLHRLKDQPLPSFLSNR